MRIISKARLVEFWQSRKRDFAIAERDLSAWYKLAKNSSWSNFAALRQTFGSADQVGNCVVFDVGNNRFRLIGRVNYTRGIIYVLQVMDHAQYDKNLWPDACGCHNPPAEESFQRSSLTMAQKATNRSKKANGSAQTLPRTYFDLVKQFPLTHIRDAAHLEAATKVIDRLLQEDHDEGCEAYIGALTDLVEVFETQHIAIPDASEADVLRELIRANGLTQPDLAKKVGIAQSTISAVLNGTRTLTKRQVITLAEVFHVSPAAFFRGEASRIASDNHPEASPSSSGFSPLCR